MSTLTGLIGGGGGDIKPTSLSGGTGAAFSVYPTFMVAAAGGGSSFQTVFTLNDSGYLVSLIHGLTPAFMATAQNAIRLYIDGTLVCTSPTVTTTNSESVQVWPPSVPNSSGSGCPLRFDTQLRVDVLRTGFNGSAFIGYVLD